MELYWGSGSPYAWRVMLGLLFKNMAYEDHLLSFSDREHKAAHYTRLNPRGKVPTLVDGEVVVTESIAILAYLDRVHPRKFLFGRNAAESGAVWSSVMEIEQYLEPAARTVIRALFFGKWQGREKELREQWSMAVEELELLERSCSDRPFDAIDCLLVPTLESLERASRKQGAAEVHLIPLNLQRWPKLHARLEGVRALPGFAATYPPHWK